MILALLAALLASPAAAAPAPEACEWVVKEFCFEDDRVWLQSATPKFRPCSGHPGRGYDFIPQLDGYVRLTDRRCEPGPQAASDRRRKSFRGNKEYLGEGVRDRSGRLPAGGGEGSQNGPTLHHGGVAGAGNLSLPPTASTRTARGRFR